MPAEPPAQIDTDSTEGAGSELAVPACGATGNAGDSVQCVPPSPDQAAPREMRRPERAARIAVVRPAAVARPTTLIWSRPRTAGSIGPARCQAPAENAKMPVVPALRQPVAMSGSPAGVQATPVSAVMPQVRVAALRASASCVD